MIQIDRNSNSYVCPFCGHTQAYYSSVDIIENGVNKNTMSIFEGNIESSFSIYTLYCKNNKCERVSVTAINSVCFSLSPSYEILINSRFLE